jgi:hypothetical protein
MRKQSKAARSLFVYVCVCVYYCFSSLEKVTRRDEIFIFLIIHATTAAAAATVAAVAYIK